MIHRPRYKQKRRYGVAVVENCVGCGRPLPDNNKHHKMCYSCWEKKELARGNLALIGGIR
jgi:hypothetical protein